MKEEERKPQKGWLAPRIVKLYKTERRTISNKNDEKVWQQPKRYYCVPHDEVFNDDIKPRINVKCTWYWLFSLNNKNVTFFILMELDMILIFFIWEVSLTIDLANANSQLILQNTDYLLAFQSHKIRKDHWVAKMTYFGFKPLLISVFHKSALDCSIGSV